MDKAERLETIKNMLQEMLDQWDIYERPRLAQNIVDDHLAWLIEQCETNIGMEAFKLIPMEEKKFVLIDLERSIKTGATHYWKGNRNGYTVNVNDVGRYDEEHARQLILHDYERNTVGVSEQRFKQLAGVE